MKWTAVLLLMFVVACSDDANPTDEVISACGQSVCVDAGSTSDVSNNDGSVDQPDIGALSDVAQDDAGINADASADAEVLPTLVASGGNEADILYGWVAAGQPSEQRVREIIATGATIISLRAVSEDPFDEPALIDSLGGTFIRYPTASANYESVAFREAMYDLYDAQLDAGVTVYLHCASSNRVGASWALYQAERKGVPSEEAIALGKTAGLASLESLVRQILGV